MFDINEVINKEIKKAYIQGRHDILDDISNIISTNNQNNNEAILAIIDFMLKENHEYYGSKGVLK